jgi:signal transduction histidine kinase
MHGQITPHDTPGGGLTMRISLPIADGQPDQEAAP